MLRLDATRLGFQPLSNYEDRLEESWKNLKLRAQDPDDALGWLNLPEAGHEFAALQAYADEVIAEGHWQHLLVLAVGGSALGAQALLRALSGHKRTGLSVSFVDNSDPDWLEQVLSELDLSRTLVAPITKSGSTAETIGAFLYVLEKLRDQVGDAWRRHIVAVTDPKKGPLRKFVREHDLPSFSVPPSVGGRYSVFTPVGMMPLALSGIRIEEFRTGMQRAQADTTVAQTLAATLYRGEMELAKPINVFMPYSSYLTGVADWYIQLVAESLGKSTEHGPTPIKAVGATDQHSQLQLFAEGPRDKVVFFLQVERFRHEIQLPQEPVSGWERLAGKSMRKLIGAELAGTSRALGESGVPNLVLEIPEINPEHLGDLLYTLEVMTALAGDLYRVNAFDQPGVELSKKYAYQELERS